MAQLRPSFCNALGHSVGGAARGLFAARNPHRETGRTRTKEGGRYHSSSPPSKRVSDGLNRLSGEIAFQTVKPKVKNLLADGEAVGLLLPQR